MVTTLLMSTMITKSCQQGVYSYCDVSLKLPDLLRLILMMIVWWYDVGQYDCDDDLANKVFEDVARVA